MARTEITEDWYTVIPEEVRDELSIKPDWTLSWEVRDGVALVVPIPPDPVRAMFGVLKGRGGPTVEDLLEERRRERERERELERRDDEWWERKKKDGE